MTCQPVWIQIRNDILSGLIWVQTVYKAVSWHDQHPSKIQISMCIHAVWSVFDKHSMGSQRSNLSSGGKLRPWSDCVEVQTDFNLRCRHMPTCTLCWIPSQLILSVVCWWLLQTVLIQIRPDILLGLIWIQTVWQSDGISKEYFWKKSADHRKAWKIITQ